MTAQVAWLNTTKAEQFNGREGETATFLFSLSFNLELRVIGFAPRHFKRWAVSLG